jgi:hypothetical protein
MHLLTIVRLLPFPTLQWVEFLCFDINVHVPHHVMSKIPWYNLRAATDSLRQVRQRWAGGGCVVRSYANTAAVCLQRAPVRRVPFGVSAFMALTASAPPTFAIARRTGEST